VTLFLGYLVCSIVFAVVGAALWHLIRARPLELESARVRGELAVLRERHAAVAAEQLRVRAGGTVRLAERHRTVKA
jgi:hypothetical protein